VGQEEEERLRLVLQRLPGEFESVVGKNIGGVKALVQGEFRRGSLGKADVFAGLSLVFGIGQKILVAIIMVETARDGSRDSHVPLAYHPGGIPGLTERREGDLHDTAPLCEQSCMTPLFPPIVKK
jgi:hypothetical protein